MTEAFSEFAHRIMENKYAFKDTKGRPKETWGDIAERVVGSVCGKYLKKKERSQMVNAITARLFLPGGRYLYASGRPYHQVNNCFLYRADDSREGWAGLLHKSSMSLMSGGGIGCDYSQIRGSGSLISRTGGKSSGPLSLMQMLNEVGRHVMQGGSRRSAIWAGLKWDHPDILDFLHLKDWSPDVIALKAKDFNFPATMDMTNISVQLDKSFFTAFNNPKNSKHNWAREIYYETCKQMFKKSEPGFSIDYDDPTESLRNACTEVTSSDDSDCCNLGSINLARIENISELEEVVDLATKFLICGSLYSDIPHEDVAAVREKNRHIGLGIMGLHEWLLVRGQPYGFTKELGEWLNVYRTISDRTAGTFAGHLDISEPVKRRAIAPTGTIGIIGETSTGIEPIYSTAFKRRYLQGTKWVYEYVVDPTAKRLIDNGTPEESIEDAYSLSRDLSGFKRRIKFQCSIQQYVDHGISSTVNLPEWGSPGNNESNLRERADALYPYLPKLRGITCYADGSRGGQPLTPVSYATAMRHKGNVIEESVDLCDLTSIGSCGS